jgi:hypothetical protein
MELDSYIIYASSEEELKKRVETWIADGWRTKGEIKVHRAKYKSETIDEEVVQYAQIVTKKD